MLALSSNLELGDNKRAPNSRVGKAVDRKKNFEFKSGRVGSGRVGSDRFSNLELVDNKPLNRVERAKASIRKKNYFSNACWLLVRISSWVIIREPPNRVEWAKASIRKTNYFSNARFESRAGR